MKGGLLREGKKEDKKEGDGEKRGKEVMYVAD